MELQITWTHDKQAGWIGKDADGNTYFQDEERKSTAAALPDGRHAAGRTPEQALEAAMKQSVPPILPTPLRPVQEQSAPTVWYVFDAEARKRAICDEQTASEICRLINDHDTLVDSLKESQDLLKKIYHGEPISGLLDCIDLNDAVLHQVKA